MSKPPNFVALSRACKFPKRHGRGRTEDVHVAVNVRCDVK
jgi:hypothetical protein